MVKPYSDMAFDADNTHKSDKEKNRLGNVGSAEFVSEPFTCNCTVNNFSYTSVLYTAASDIFIPEAVAEEMDYKSSKILSR